MYALLLLASLVFRPAISSTTPPISNPNRILLSAISTLTLYSGELTTSRRVPPVPQAQCVSSAPLCDTAEITFLRCHKDGSTIDQDSIQWFCEAETPLNIGLGEVQVTCEGWDVAGDPWVLKGSCGVRYHVVELNEDQPQGKWWMGLVAFGVLGVLAASAVLKWGREESEKDGLRTTQNGDGDNNRDRRTRDEEQRLIDDEEQRRHATRGYGGTEVR